METPNIFNYATSELSQDAFILWFLDWANPNYASKDEFLYETAQCFVHSLLGNNDIQITSIKCDKQKLHIDIFVVVNDQYFILIEDKIHTTEHGLQMTKYSQEIDKVDEFKNLQKICVYLKTGNESAEHLDIINKGYNEKNTGWTFRFFLRKDFLEIIKKYEGSNSILLDFREKLENIEKDFLSYRRLPINEWSWAAWQGFYTELANHIPDLWWGSVNPKSGAFMCAAWSQIQNKDCILKLQLEGYSKDTELKKSRLCIKIQIPNDKKLERSNLMFSLYGELKKIADSCQIKLNKPKRYSYIGKVLTLACVEIDKIIYGEFDINRILLNIDKYEELIKCVEFKSI